MASYKTGLILQGAPLPPNFRGTPQQFFEAILDRMEIVAPFAIPSFVIGPNKPQYNAGPWLKNGTQWWVWSDDAADYIPLDVSQSQLPVYVVQKDTPDTPVPPLWFRLDATETIIDGLFFYINGAWQSLGLTAGTTGERPTAPTNLEQYYDSTIQTLIWWERGKWRTMAGTPGDVKFCTFGTAAEALTRNPGWEVLGLGNEGWRGCVIGQATQDDTGTGTVLAVNGPNITAHGAKTVVGAETHVLTRAELPIDKTLNPFMASTGDSESTTFPYGQGPAIAGSGKCVDDSGGNHADRVLPYNEPMGSGTAHTSVQPTLYLWALTKQ